jgi:predicted MFS family arabinose efflux permease
VTSTSTSAAADRPERLLRGYTGRLLLIVSLGWAAIQCGRLVLSPLLTEIQASLGIGSTRAGFALTVIWGLYAALQYPSGHFSDVLSRKTLLVSGIGLVVVGFAALATAPTYLVFLAGAAVVGLGAGLYPTAARALVADLFVERRGQAFGLHTSSGDVGGVAAAGLATAVLAVATWRFGFVPVVALLLPVAVALHVWSDESYVLERPSLDIVGTVKRLFAEPQFRWLLAAYVLFAFSWQSTTGFLPTYLKVGKSFSPAVANVAFAVLFGVGAVAKPVAGAVGDRVPRRLLAPAVLGFAAVSLAGVVLSTTPLVALASVTLFAAGLMSFPPVMQSYLMDAFPDDSAGGDLGATRTMYIGVGALGPTYVGAVADVVAYDVAFWGIVGCLVGASTLVLWTARRY